MDGCDSESIHPAQTSVTPAIYILVSPNGRFGTGVCEKHTPTTRRQKKNLKAAIVN